MKDHRTRKPMNRLLGLIYTTAAAVALWAAAWALAKMALQWGGYL